MNQHGMDLTVLDQIKALNPKFKVNDTLKGKFAGTFRNVGVHVRLSLETQEIHYILQSYIDEKNQVLTEGCVTLPETVLEKV